jgi:hypothetical protein
MDRHRRQPLTGLLATPVLSTPGGCGKKAPGTLADDTSNLIDTRIAGVFRPDSLSALQT